VPGIGGADLESSQQGQLVTAKEGNQFPAQPVYPGATAHDLRVSRSVTRAVPRGSPRRDAQTVTPITAFLRALHYPYR
jgi:hypothetical protein